MSKKKNKNFKKEKIFTLPIEIKHAIMGILMILASVLIVLSFFERAGKAGEYFMKGARLLGGNTVFILPLVFILGGLVFLNSKANQEFLNRSKKVFWPVVLASFIFLSGITGILGSIKQELKRGGWLGYLFSWPFLKYFGFWATLIIFSALTIIGGIIFLYFLRRPHKEKEEKENVIKIEQEDKPSIIKKIFAPKFKVKSIVSEEEHKEKENLSSSEDINVVKPERKQGKIFTYIPPSLDLLDAEKGVPTSGDTKLNSAIIKKTLQNFNIDVTMSEVNIGPTVTQYAFKPAEGVKLSKITGLSNDLSLALAAHPIRIEAPIPGRSLVGVEIPNKGRAEVRLRNLIENDAFQKASGNLILTLGRDVSGVPVYADLTKMPHLLVAGATGTGKTVSLNALIMSLLYQPSTSVRSAGPENLRLILVDPKRVEFPVYSKLPHLLCPVIYNADQTIGALRWLTSEMERRFDVLASAKSRDIGSFNEKALSSGAESLPFIVVIIDELADLMAAKGREIEAGIVRLAQMARAVGIHLIVATQRPSVEVITGLIKANITSRITFQVASQVDSRTVLDTAGAEKLLGRGDSLYLSAYTPKPRRIQAPYVSEKEIKRVVKHIIDKEELILDMDQDLIGEMEKTTEGPGNISGIYFGEDDPLLEDAKNVVIESNKASASLLQRRLRVGYARAARLIDILEEKGIVGPAEGAKPREVYGEQEEASEDGDKGEWEKI